MIASSLGSLKALKHRYGLIRTSNPKLGFVYILARTSAMDLEQQIISSLEKYLKTVSESATEYTLAEHGDEELPNTQYRLLLRQELYGVSQAKLPIPEWVALTVGFVFGDLGLESLEGLVEWFVKLESPLERHWNIVTGYSLHFCYDGLKVWVGLGPTKPMRGALRGLRW